MHHSVVICHWRVLSAFNYVDTAGTGVVEDSRLAEIIPTVMDLTPRGIRETLTLSAPIYAASAAMGILAEQQVKQGQGHFLGKT